MPSSIKSVRVRQYRSFRDETTLELRRITLLYGWNNSGKSALARLVPLIAESLGGPGPRALPPGLNLRSPVLRGAGFRHLVWSGPLDDEDRMLVIELQGPNRKLRVGLEWFDDWSLPVIKQLCVEDHQSSVKVEWDPRRDERHADARSYRRRDDGTILPIGFDGLIPSSPMLPWLRPLADSLASIATSVAWLGSVRVGPSREFRIDGPPGLLYDSGSEADRITYVDSGLRERVSSFYERITGLSIGRISIDATRATLGLARGNFTVEFPDTGEGLQQVFAVIVGLEQLRDGSSDLLVIEEPDSHLHPEAQEQLAARIVDVIATNPDARVVLETHSEVLLTAIQTEVAAGRLAACDVACYWIDQDGSGASRAELIELDEAGRFTSSDFMEGFRQLGELRRRLLSERKRQGHHAG